MTCFVMRPEAGQHQVKTTNKSNHMGSRLTAILVSLEDMSFST